MTSDWVVLFTNRVILLLRVAFTLKVEARRRERLYSPEGGKLIARIDHHPLLLE